MKILVIGATGFIGNRVVEEAIRRHHVVTAVARRGNLDRVAGAQHLSADASDPGAIDPLIADADAVVLTIRAHPGREQDFLSATRTVLAAVGRSRSRLLVVGGAGPLRSPTTPEVTVLDDPRFVPPQWKAVARASSSQLDECRRHGEANWTYLSPPALVEPGVRTGTYRRGTDRLLLAHDGTSRISAEDLAVAVIDELEYPGTEPWFTVGY
jgi:hypothetical protein